MMLFLYGIHNALKLTSDLYTCTIQKYFQILHDDLMNQMKMERVKR
jgi:hypothetical protein